MSCKGGFLSVRNSDLDLRRTGVGLGEEDGGAKAAQGSPCSPQALTVCRAPGPARGPGFGQGSGPESEPCCSPASGARWAERGAAACTPRRPRPATLVPGPCLQGGRRNRAGAQQMSESPWVRGAGTRPGLSDAPRLGQFRLSCWAGLRTAGRAVGSQVYGAGHCEVPANDTEALPAAGSELQSGSDSEF